jgi:hypothetical protein
MAYRFAIAASSGAMKSPGRGDRGLRTKVGGGVGGCLPSNQKSEPLHVDGGFAVGSSSFRPKGRRVLSTARRRDRPPRISPLQSALLSGRV